MARKGFTLYKIETVEVVEEGTPEESGYKYRYLGDADSATAVAEAPVATARAKAEASSTAAKIEANSSKTRARLRDDAAEARTRKITAPAASGKVNIEGVEIGGNGGDAPGAKSKRPGAKSAKVAAKAAPVEEPEEIELDEPDELDLDEPAELDAASDDDLLLDEPDELDDVVEEVEALDEPDELDLSDDDDPDETSVGKLSAAADDDEIPELDDDIPSLDEEPTDESNDEKQDAKKKTGKLAGKTGRLGLAAGKTGRLAAGKTGKLGRSSTGRIKKEGDEGAEGDGAEGRTRAVGGAKGISTSRHKMMVYGSYLTVVLCIVLGIWIYIVRTQANEEAYQNATNAGAIEKEKEKLIPRLLQSFTKFYMDARGYKEKAGQAFADRDDAAFQENAKKALSFAFTALSLYHEAQWQNLEVGGKPLDEGNTQYTQQAREVKKIIYTMHNVPGCPHNDDPMIAQQLKAYNENRLKVMVIKVDRALKSSDVDEILTSFEDMSGECMVLLNEDLAEAMEADQVNADTVRDIALEAYELGLRALACHYRLLTVKGESATDIDRNPGTRFREQLEEIASRDGLPALTEAPAYEVYQKARTEYGGE